MSDFFLYEIGRSHDIMSIDFFVSILSTTAAAEVLPPMLLNQSHQPSMFHVAQLVMSNPVKPTRQNLSSQKKAHKCIKTASFLTPKKTENISCRFIRHPLHCPINIYNQKERNQQDNIMRA